jgi:hypothetical protein
MFLALFLGLIVSIVAVFTFVNVRGPLVPTDQEPYVHENFRFFNPCSTTNSRGLVATSWRYSNRCYCPDRWLPLVHTYSKQSSFIKISIGGQYSNARVLDTSAFGPADGYEDPRIAWLDDATLFIVFVRFVKNPDTSEICAGLIDVSPDGSISMTRTRMYTSSQRQKNWMAKINDDKTIDLYARVESPQIVYHLCPSELKGHSIIHVPKCTLKSTWRGSSFFCPYKKGHVALVHQRLRPQLQNRFMPSYEYALCYLQDGHIKIGPTFQLKDPKGFVYASGLQIINDSLLVSMGITDCYASSAVLPAL